MIDKETLKARESHKMDRMWMAVVALRLVWTAIGQLGYIHPDEFFQTVEIVAGCLSLTIFFCTLLLNTFGHLDGCDVNPTFVVLRE